MSFDDFCINKIFVKLGTTPTQTNGKMIAAHMNYKVSRRLIFKWHKPVLEGRESLEDDSRIDRPGNVR